jgi:hypothetical protein
MTDIAENLNTELTPDEVYKSDASQSGINPLASVGSLGATAKAIMEELKEWNKKIEKQFNSSDLHPSVLYTLEKLPEALDKYQNLTQQMKSPGDVFFAFRQLTDFEKNGLNRCVYLYPFLIKDGNKVTPRVAAVTSPQDVKLEVENLRTSCFNYSKELIDAILNSRSKKAKTIEPGSGRQLFANINAKQTWFFPKMSSLEFEVVQLLKKGFTPYPFLPLNDFIKDFINYGVEKKKVLSILSDFSIIIDDLALDDQGNLARAPELIAQIGIQCDGLDKFFDLTVMPFARENNYQAFISQYTEFKASYPTVPVISNDIADSYIDEIIKVARSFPMGTGSGSLDVKIEDTLFTVIKIIEGLKAEKANINARKNRAKYNNIRDTLIKKVDEWTNTNSRMLKVNFREEFIKAGIRDEEELDELSERLKKDIQKVYPVEDSKDSEGNPSSYIVDQGYLALVINKLTVDSRSDSEAKIEYAHAKKIDEKLKKISDKSLNAKIKSDVEKVETFSKEKLVQIEEEEEEETESKHYNTVMGILGFFASSMLFIFIGYYFKILVVLVLGFPVGLGIGVFIAIYFRDRAGEEEAEEKEKKSKKDGSGNVGSDSSNGNSAAAQAAKEKSKQLKEIFKASEAAVFGSGPAKKYSDKMIPIEVFRDKIKKNLGDIKSKSKALSSESDNNKISKVIEQTLMKGSAVINIPESIKPPEMPGAYVITHANLKSEVFRQKLGEELRKEMENKKSNQAMVKYYSFLVNTIEMNFYKFLPKK